MKLSAFATVAALAFTGCSSQEKPTATPATAAPTAQSAPGTSSGPLASRPAEKSTRERTYSSFDRTPEARKEIGVGAIQFNEADVRLVLDLYQELSGRSVIHSARVPKNLKITFRNGSPLSRVEALQALDTVLAAQGIVMVYSGDQYVKACSAVEAPTEVPPMLSVPWRELPDSMSFLSYSVPLKNVEISSAISALQPFARLPNSIIGHRESNMLILRDYSTHVRRMMEVLERIDGNNAAPEK